MSQQPHQQPVNCELDATDYLANIDKNIVKMTNTMLRQEQIMNEMLKVLRVMHRDKTTLETMPKMQSLGM